VTLSVCTSKEKQLELSASKSLYTDLGKLSACIDSEVKGWLRVRMDERCESVVDVTAYVSG